MPSSSEATKHGPVHARGGLHWRTWTAEFLGTALLIIGGLSAVTLDFSRDSPVAAHLASHSLRLLLTGALFAGTGSLVAVSPFGRLSGAHLNPAVTLAFATQKKVHRDDVAGYLCAQLLGATAGAGFVRLVWGWRAVSVSDGVTRPGGGLGPWQAAGVEALMTATLVLVIFAFTSSARTARLTPIATWVCVTVFVWQVAPYTGTSLNPARSIGPAVVSGDYAVLWVYVLGPLGGSLIAGVAWSALGRDLLTSKLFHDPNYPSVLASLLPVRLLNRRHEPVAP